MAGGPGPVAAVHRVFIASALACAVIYALWELREMARGAGPAAGLRAGVALAVGVVIAVYLRSLRRLGTRLTPPEGPPDSR
jgi:hypothetical protein